MIEGILNFPQIGEYHIGGFAADMIQFTIDNQLLDTETWKLFVNQFRIHSDAGNTWKGEYWGKMMRGGCITYRATKNTNLYNVLTASVKDLLTTQEPSGRISSCTVKEEFRNWDMWSRKYVMLGLIYYLDICKSEALKKKIISALMRHADYILAHIGEDKKSIFDTAAVYGGLNACSILEPFVKLYVLTGEARYFDFATYIVRSGCCKDFNLIETCIAKELYPYQFKQVKAYEMMSCLEGVLEYYRVTEEEKYLTAVKNFVDMVVETDYTIIGCSGCTHELFDHSTETQTEPTEEVVQETCVTVTFMKLCAKLLAVTGDAKYAEYIERSGYNAMFGAVNSEQRPVTPPHYAEKVNGELPHVALPFDSYSPLVYDRKGRKIAGYQPLEGGRLYGCCACIGSAGTGIFGLFGIMENAEGYAVNVYNDGVFKTERGGKKVSVRVMANVYKKAGAVIKVNGNGASFALDLRVPSWAEDFVVTCNDEPVAMTMHKGYLRIARTWGTDTVQISYKMPVKMHVKNKKIAFTRGPIVLCRDERFGDIAKPVHITAKNGRSVRAKLVKNEQFFSNLTVKIATKDGDILLCDYSQAGKHYDAPHSKITVWQEVV